MKMSSSGVVFMERSRPSKMGLVESFLTALALSHKLI